MDATINLRIQRNEDIYLALFSDVSYLLRLESGGPEQLA